MIFSNNLLLSEGLKVLINIATNESSSRNLIAKHSASEIKSYLRNNELLFADVEFLLSRLFFLLSINQEGANVLFSDSEPIEIFITKKLEHFSQNDSDESELGIIIIDIMRYRYNLIHHGIKKHER